MAPEVAGLVPKIAEPAAAWPGFELERHGDAIGPRASGSGLIEHRFENDRCRGVDLEVLLNFQDEISGEILRCGCAIHGDSFCSSAFRCAGVSCAARASATALMRLRWCVQNRS